MQTINISKDVDVLIFESSYDREKFEYEQASAKNSGWCDVCNALINCINCYHNILER